MKTRTVVLAPEAEDDLSAHAAERGAHHAAIRQGLRSVGFEGRVTIVPHVDQSTVSILRVFPADRNWTEEIAPESGDE